MLRALRDLLVLFEDASHIMLSSPVSLHLLTRGQAASQSSGSDSSLGVVQRLPLRRYVLRASTPVRGLLRPEARLATPFDQELPPPGTFRPCRSSRLRRFSPLEHRRLVSSCNRPWGSPRFGSVPPSLGQVWWCHPKVLLSSLAEVVGGYHLFPLDQIRRSSLVAQRGRPILLVAWSPFEGFPSLAAVSGGVLCPCPVCPVKDSSTSLQLAPARAFSSFKMMTFP